MYTHRHAYKFQLQISTFVGIAAFWFGVSNQNEIANKMVNEIGHIGEGGSRRSEPIPFMDS